jgi:antitoxin component YwqK of YwqJK toxin-antitoxin module
MRILLLFFLSMFYGYCSSVPEKKKVLFDFEKPNLRIDNYSETFNLKGKGPVLCTEKNPNCKLEEGQEFAEDEIKKFIKNGLWEEYSEKTPEGEKPKYSVLDKKGAYEKGKKEGEWNSYYDEGPGKVGPILRTTTFKENKKVGVEKKFTKEGMQTEEAFYKEDLKDGPYWSKNRKGWWEEKGNYSMDKKEGEWTFYYAEEKDDQIKSITNYKIDLKEGKQVRFHPNGSKSAEGNFSKDLEIGPWVFYYDNQKPEYEGSFQPIVSDGEDEFDKIKPADQKPKSKKVGIWRRYYKSGGVFSEGERDGKLTKGIWKFYHKNGNLAGKGTMTNDLMMAEGEVYDVDGVLEAKGKFMVSFFNLNLAEDEMKLKYRPSTPFIKYNKGKKYLEITDASKESIATAFLYDENEKKIGEGPIEPNTQKKNGCWTINNKKVYFLMDSERTGKIAQMNKCE